MRDDTRRREEGDKASADLLKIFIFLAGLLAGYFIWG